MMTIFYYVLYFLCFRGRRKTIRGHGFKRLKSRMLFTNLPIRSEADVEDRVIT